jgi:predicted ATP-grasp superfamily ATP-dependent carboligase
MDELYQRATDCAEQIKDITNRMARRDLLRMLKAVDSALNHLDSESVECRRLNKSTSRYETLKKQAEEQVLNLEKHLTLARLMYT